MAAPTGTPPQKAKRRRTYEIFTDEDLRLCEEHAVLPATPLEHHLIETAEAPEINLHNSRKLLGIDYGNGEFITMKVDFVASQIMTEFLQQELVVHRGFTDYDVCDVGFWDLDVSTDSGFSWHHDLNWNGFLHPSHRSYHGWFVNAATEDCNSTLAISTNGNYNECYTNSLIGIVAISSDELIKPDIIVPLKKNMLVLFPYGAAHRTYRFKAPDELVGHRLCTSFVLHHKDDRLNDAKLSKLTDEQVCNEFGRYVLEKNFGTNHYLVKTLERIPRTKRLMAKLYRASLAANRVR